MKSPGLFLALPPAMLFLATALRAAPAPDAAAVPSAPAPSAVAVVQPAPENRMHRLTEQDVLRQFDKNGDGKLDEDEVAAAHDAMMKVQLERKEERKEKKAGGAPGEKLRQQLLEKFDTNHDGKLDDTERAAAQAYAKEHGLGERMREAGKAMREQILARFDQDGNGQLDEAEWGAAAPVLRQRLENAPGMMRRFDRNGDGKLDDAEWAAASVQLQRMINHPRPATASGHGSNR